MPDFVVSVESAERHGTTMRQDRPMTRERAAALLAEGETDLAEAKRQQHRELVETLRQLVAERRMRVADLEKAAVFRAAWQAGAEA